MKMPMVIKLEASEIMPPENPYSQLSYNIEFSPMTHDTFCVWLKDSNGTPLARSISLNNDWLPDVRM
jgi:hypothetical protein